MASKRGHRVGQQGPLVAQHLELDPVGARVVQLREDFAAQPGHPDGVLRREAAGRVRQDRVAAGVDEVQQVLALGVDQPLAADRHGDALRARDVQRLGHALVGGVLAGADDQPAGKRVGADPQFIRHDAILALPKGTVPFSSNENWDSPLSSAHQGDDFQAVAFGQSVLGVALPGDQFAIDFDRQRLTGQPQFVQ